ncbi:uncharacterized protein G2W53_017714 [Senna tora]|uniref:Uncharacterized protein n=1 Tax=Senna tora TaxID=362788 RepID=A0A834WKF2_9FABA|nr:uncharacterized protein G2W53_017714 [Senna tora]
MAQSHEWLTKNKYIQQVKAVIKGMRHD